MPGQTRFEQRRHQFGEQFSHKVIDVCLFGEQQQFVYFGTRYIQQIVDEQHEMLSAALNRDDIVPHICPNRHTMRSAVGNQELAIAQNYVQRCTQLVADVCEQSGLETIGLFGDKLRLPGCLIEIDVLEGDADLVRNQLQTFDFTTDMRQKRRVL